ncbi:uncharacterized protein H6S33_013168 [Morchella sextelata]|uniref:uncharacterized protein n=1 Tax=Morchella sextelata TaxID=1174677 RepID=UPI001D04A757|nr:uncharacterized protein H6S33_013168 [Morchella sextelata]KAH0609682.1 hypothetical protein H6S33_013168 [Morchella sextelata]
MHVSVLLLLSLTTVATARTRASWAWSSLGCFVDRDVPNRLLGSVIMTDAYEQTVERCLARCSAYNYALVENGRECFCGSTINNGTSAAMSECNFKCPGDSTEVCGGVWRGEIYEKGPSAWCVGAPGPIFTSEEKHFQVQEL